MKKPLLFSLDGDEELALQSLREGEGRAELDILERLVSVVLSGGKVNPVFQSVVNAIVAKAVISGKLPTERKGRPVNFMHRAPAWAIAERYLELMDGGLTTYAEAIERVADEFLKDDGNRMSDRQIERLVREVKPAVESRMGGTAKERNLFRGRSNRRDETELSAENAECVARVLAMVDAAQAVLEEHLANEEQRNYLADLDGLINQALKQGIPDDIK